MVTLSTTQSFQLADEPPKIPSHTEGVTELLLPRKTAGFLNREQGRDYDKSSSSAEERCPAVSFEGVVGWLHSFQSAMTMQSRPVQHCCIFSTG